MANVTPFVDFLTSNDSGENNAASIKPIQNGEAVDATVQGRPDEILRQRTEVLRQNAVDSLYLQNADRTLIISGPGKVTWPGSTSVGQSGIPTLDDVLWILPMLTPGSAQAQPVPPVASKYGTLHLKRSSDSLDSILVTSQRRSYAAGDQINITVSAGSAFSCVLDTEDTGTYRRTIKIVAAPTTTLGTVISALNGLAPLSPDNAQLVTAALENGALNTDVVLSPQSRQFVSGNYDGEGHTISPSNLASFFSSNPTQALAEGDTLCVAFAMLSDSASTGGRRQAIPENTNTPVTVGMFFNSRVHPEKLVNALPICKVINGSLVFGTGIEIPAGNTAALGNSNVALQAVVRNGGFERGFSGFVHRFGIAGWHNDLDNATNGNFRKGTSGAYAGGGCLEFNRTSASAATAHIDQLLYVPVTPGRSVRLIAAVKQLIAPTGGTYAFRLLWNSADGSFNSYTVVTFQVLASTDSSWRLINQAITVPVNAYALTTVRIEVVSVTTATTGVSLLVDSVQVFAEILANAVPPGIDDTYRSMITSGIQFVDPVSPDTYSSALRMLGDGEEITPGLPSAPLGGTLSLEGALSGSTGPALAVLGQLWAIGASLLGSSSSAATTRINMPHAAAYEWTLLFESPPLTAGQPTTRLYARNTGELWLVVNARLSGTQWFLDVEDRTATAIALQSGNAAAKDGITFYAAVPETGDGWVSSAWPKRARLCAPMVMDVGVTPRPMLTLYDTKQNVRVAFDHLGFLREQGVVRIKQNWLAPMKAAWTLAATAGSATTFVDVSTDEPGPWIKLAPNNTGTVAFTSETLINPSLTGLNANGLWVVEFSVNGAALTGTPSMNFKAGFSDNNDPATLGSSYILLSKTAGSSNWRLKTGDTGAGQSDINTGIAVSSTAPQRFRLEVYSGGNAGQTARMLLYIDGVCVAKSLAFPENADMAFVLAVDNNTGASRQVDVSPVTITIATRYNDDEV